MVLRPELACTSPTTSTSRKYTSLFRHPRVYRTVQIILRLLFICLQLDRVFYKDYGFSLVSRTILVAKDMVVLILEGCIVHN
jgi:hypothetical protein